MNKLRKIIALMLSLSVIFTAAISVFSAENFDDDGNRDNDAGLSDEEQNVLIQDSHPKHELDNPDDAYIEDIEYDTYIMGKNEYDETVKKPCMKPHSTMKRMSWACCNEYVCKIEH